MRPRSRQLESGQAAAELAIAATLFVPLVLFLYQGFRLLYAKMELVQLCGQAALHMIHEQSQDAPEGELSRLASRSRMDPGMLSCRTESPGLLLGTRLVVEYRFHFGGSLERAFPEGILLRESVLLQADCWKGLGADKVWKMLKGGA
jgi:hypothetical protein